MRRFTIAALMLGVLVCGVAFAALKDSSDAWAGVLLMLTLLLLGASILGVLYRRDGGRAFWAGFALFGCSYMLIQHVPRLWDQAVEPLPTASLLKYVHANAAPHRNPPVTYTYRMVTQMITVNSAS